MTVFVAHAQADLAAAEGLEKAIERRGQFVELDDGQTALRPVRRGDVLVLLVSQNLLFSPTRLRIEQRALDAWAEGRLVVVKLDRGLAPVGLRDLPAIDAAFEAQREPFAWMKVAEAVAEKQRAARQAPAPQEPEAPGEGAPPPLRRRSATIWTAVGWLLLSLPGLAALAAAISIWLVNRIGPVPGGWPELFAGIDDLGVRFGAPAGAGVWLFAAAIVVTLLIFAVFVARLVTGVVRRGSRASRKPEAPQEQGAAASAVFVSYARANQGMVLPVIDAARAQGKTFWVDQQGGVVSGDSWAGEIVRAIRGAAEVVVMCSKAAFESDHVKREIYLADRYKKRLLPVFIEAAEPPEDFEYFFAGVQALNLFEKPESERPQAFVAVLG